MAMSVQMKVKKVLKIVVRGLQNVLPAPVFNRIYEVIFPLYKELIRASYIVKAFFLYRFFDPDAWRMARKIYGIMPYTLVGIGGLEASYKAVKEVNRKRIEGDVIELGVARGGCAALMGKAIFDGDEPNPMARNLWLFDSFEGLPEPTNDDFDSKGGTTGDHVRPLPKGSCLGTLPEVRQLLIGFYKLPESSINFVQGWFQDTIPVTTQKIEKIAILRIDGDWYESTKVCLEGLYDKVVDGGVVIIDDYQSCYGCEKAVDEFVTNRSLNVKITLDGRGGCYFLKC